MLQKLTLRVASLSVLFLSIIFLYSCVDQSVKPKPTPNPNPTPLPDNLCHAHIINGYTDKVSYGKEEKVKAFLQSNESIDLCRLDVYDINGVLSFSVASPLIVQKSSTPDPFSNGYGYLPTIEFELPQNLASGIYRIENLIPFLVKTTEPVDLLIVYPSNTVNAYCISGGKSLYTPTDKPTDVSFLRPMEIQSFAKQCLTWFMTLSNVSIGYCADIDLENYSSIEKAKILVIVGHNEYWTRKARINFDQFVDQGKHALILSGNTMWWQVRYSDDQSKLICYKDVPDPIEDPLLKSMTWDKPALSYSILSSLGADFPHGGYGLKSDNGWNGYKIVTPDSPLLEGLNLKKGDIISVPTSEFDGTPISDFDSDGFPIIDKALLNVDKIELIGFDKGYRVNETYGTFFVMKKSPTSGIIINTSSTDWCADGGMGGSSGNAIKKITYNAIDKLLHNESVFSSDIQ